jgi:hypothetical protein
MNYETKLDIPGICGTIGPPIIGGPVIRTIHYEMTITSAIINKNTELFVWISTNPDNPVAVVLRQELQKQRNELKIKK